MFHVVLYQPEIPPNTGNIIRLCANTGATLHLIEPLGFTLDDRQLKRAGLDYHDLTAVNVHKSLVEFRAGGFAKRLFALSTKGTRPYSDMDYADGDAFLFGPETRGLPAEILEDTPADRRLKIPQQAGNRSLNLSNAVAVVVYEAWRQTGFS